MELVWNRPSPRLWVAECDGRTFRIERTGVIRQQGSAKVTEVDKYLRVVGDHETIVTTVNRGKEVARLWLEGKCFECRMDDGSHKLDCSQPRKANMRRELNKTANTRPLYSS